MRDPVTIVHETGKIAVVPRRQVKALKGWRLADDDEAADDTDQTSDDELETYERATDRFDSPDES